MEKNVETVKFKVEKKGYSIKEVDNYILELLVENERLLQEKTLRIDELRQENFKLLKQLENFKKNENNISKTLIYAQNKAEEIEQKSKQKLKTELKNLDDFYEKWQTFFDELLKKYPLLEFDTKNILNSLKNDINNLIKNEFHIEKIPSKNSGNAFENLLDKLKSHKSPNAKPEKVVLKVNKNANKQEIIESENEIEFMGETNKMHNIKPITNLTLTGSEQEEFDSLLDKFLHSENRVSKGYENSILNKGKKGLKSNKYPEPNESGFDFEQALNPTDDLLNIMKGFKLDE